MSPRARVSRIFVTTDAGDALASQNRAASRVRDDTTPAATSLPHRDAASHRLPETPPSRHHTLLPTTPRVRVGGYTGDDERTSAAFHRAPSAPRSPPPRPAHHLRARRLRTSVERRLGRAVRRAPAERPASARAAGARDGRRARPISHTEYRLSLGNARTLAGRRRLRAGRGWVRAPLNLLSKRNRAGCARASCFH